MLNLLKPWMCALLLAASSLSANHGCCEPDEDCLCCPEMICREPLCAPTLSAFAAPARIDVCSRDYWADASFIYWQALEDNLELGIANYAPTSIVIDSAYGMFGNIVNMPANYQPGFKVGVGFSLDRDDWDVHSEYTWFRSQQSVSSNSVIGGVVLAMQAAPSDDQGNNYNSGSGTWKLGMDLFDLDLGRWQYCGLQYIVRPYFGARGALIRQNYQAVYVNDQSLVVAGVPVGTADVMTITQNSRSWGIGPRAGLDGTWLIGAGFKVLGNGSIDILYTQYTTLSYNSTHSPAMLQSGISVEGTVIGLANQSVTQTDASGLRTHLDLEMGLGWAHYFANHTYHIDFEALYGFQVFYEQNMFRNFVNDVMRSKSIDPDGNLYIHGLTVSARMDF